MTTRPPGATSWSTPASASHSRPIIRRVEEHEIKDRVAVGRQRLQRPIGSRADNSIAVLDAARAPRFSSMSPLGPAVRFHKRDPGRPSAERLDANRTGAGIHVQHPCVMHAGREHVEQRSREGGPTSAAALPTSAATTCAP